MPPKKRLPALRAREANRVAATGCIQERGPGLDDLPKVKDVVDVADGGCQSQTGCGAAVSHKTDDQPAASQPSQGCTEKDPGGEELAGEGRGGNHLQVRRNSRFISEKERFFSLSQLR